VSSNERSDIWGVELIAGEIATAFVRIRPSLVGFKGAATEGIKASLAETQTAVNTTARANVAATNSEVSANKALALSYEEVRAVAQLNVDAVAQGVSANRALAASYAEIGAAAAAGSVEAIAALKLETEAATGAAATVQEAAAANVAAAAREIAANREIAASYLMLSTDASLSADARIAAAALAARAAETNAAATASAAGRGVSGGAAGAVGKAAIPVIAGFLGIHFVKELANQAAEVQKSQEVVRSEFGKSAEIVEGFANKSAAALGITDDAALATAAKLGIVFDNLGIGQKTAATMTVGLEKLAGSLAAVRGIDPSVPLKALSLAMLGNVRSLKQLGISIDPVTVKYVAFKLGLIDSVKSALTPAARAQAIYAISTQNLAKFQALAAAHADDLATRQRKLSAEFDDAKDKLGKDLLPAFSGFVGIMSKLIGGFLALPVAAKAAIGGIVGIGVVAGAVALLVAGVIGPLVAIPVALVAVGLAFNEAYRHSEKFRDAVHAIGGFITGTVVPAFKKLATDVTPSIKAIGAGFADLGRSIVAATQQILRIWGFFGEQIKSILKGHLQATLSIIVDVFRIIAGYFSLFSDLIHGRWREVWGDLKKIAGAELHIVLTVIKTVANDIKQVFVGMWHAIEFVFLSGLKKIADLLAQIPTKVTIFGKTIGGTNPFKGWSDGLQSAIDGIGSNAVTDAINKQKKAISDGINAHDPATASRAQAQGKVVGEGIVKGASDAIKGSGKTLAQEAADYNAGAAADSAAAKAQTAFTKAHDAVAKTEQQIRGLKTKLTASIVQTATDLRQSVEDAKANLSGIGQSLASSLSTIIDQPFVIAGQKIQAAQNKITLEFDRKSQALQAQAAAIQRQQSQIAFEGDKLNLHNLSRSVVFSGGGTLSDDPTKGLAQLKKLAASLHGTGREGIEAFILQFKSAALQVKGDKIGLKQSALDAKRGALETALRLKSELLAVEQDTANKLKTKIAQQIADLTDAFNRHVITYARFKKGIHDIVAQGGPAMKQAGKTLGTAFANQYVQQVNDILTQAGLIAAAPNVAGTTGQDHKVVNPNTALHADQAASTKIRVQIAQKNLALQQQHVKEAKKLVALAQAQAAKDKHPKSKDKNPGRQSIESNALAGTTAGYLGRHH
jgi:hypothetical protein